MRPKGVVSVRSVNNPTGVLAEEAKTINREKQEERIARAERRANQEVPNYKCYPNLFPPHLYDPKTGRWSGGILPACRVCGIRLQPNENHKCEGFKPKYKEHTKESHERFEARREEIKETRRQISEAPPVCSVCGEEMPDYWTDGQRHWDAHEGRPVRDHYALDGEPDGDLDGYDDEPEDDYCDGDDDGCDCD